jgi:hypothetical protein
VRVCMLWFLFSSAGISDSPAIVRLHYWKQDTA